MTNLSASSIIRTFRILGLHGYKDVEIDFSGPVRIVIAENGTGKTTILGALNALLTSDYEKLRTVDFQKVECEFVGSLDTASLRRDQLPQTSKDVGRQIAELARFTSFEPPEMRSAIHELDPDNLNYQLSTPSVFYDIYANSPWGREEIASKILSIKEELGSSASDDLKQLTASIKAALGRAQVLYLPTYRRVELSVGRSEASKESWPSSRNRIRRASAPRSRWAQYGIQFGLGDVEGRLLELTDEIQRSSNFGYRSLSADIISDLLAGSINEVERANLPSIEDLTLFFSRIEGSASSSRGEGRLAEIKRLYETEEIQSAELRPLRYFLAKLSNVVNRTRQNEQSIEQFVEKANAYLTESSDSKMLHYDPRRMKVFVRNSWTGSEVKLDDLSSGEKQVISLMAHLYLYQDQKVVLIDEPELSLSIDWQRRLLPDMIESPTCVQLLAITHSPFVFDNELDPYAGPFKVERRKVS